LYKIKETEMKNSKDFDHLKNKHLALDKFIEDTVYSDFEEDIYPAVVYMNTLNSDNINAKEFESKLKELGFIPTKGKEGVDDVYKVTIK